MKKNYILLNFIVLLLSFGALRLSAQCTTAASVPYVENFGSITANNQLPVCWTASNLGSTCLTFSNIGASVKCAAFSNTLGGDSYFYTGAVNMVPGINYSISVLYIIGLGWTSDWTDFSLWIGPNQSTVGLTPIVSTLGPPVAPAWTGIAKVFTVSAPGNYYVAIKASSTAGSAPNLYWDDFAIKAPCSINDPLTQSIPIGPTTTANCLGYSLTVSTSSLMTGAHTFTWSNGSNASTTTFVLDGSPNVYLAGTNTLSGCSTTMAIPTYIKPLPKTKISAPPKPICLGKDFTLTATGADNYLWSTGSTLDFLQVINPTINATYSVTGTTIYGCSLTATIAITVNTLPTLVITGSAAICVGASSLLKVSGANTYLWELGAGNQNVLDSVRVYPLANSVYTVSGSDVLGCAASKTIELVVDKCTELSESEKDSHQITVYPNPTKDIITIDSKESYWNRIVVRNLLGQVVLNWVSNDPIPNKQINIAELKNGIYFLQVFDRNKLVSIQKIVKE